MDDFRAELWQGGIMVACVEGSDESSVQREINHYALVYSEDGPCTIKIHVPPPCEESRMTSCAGLGSG